MRSFSAWISSLLSPSNSLDSTTTVSEASRSSYSRSSLRKIGKQKEKGEDNEEVEGERWSDEEGKEEGRGSKMETRVRDRRRAYAVLSSVFEMFNLMKDTGIDLHDPIYASLLKVNLLHLSYKHTEGERD